jgi:Uma2 family endonuclease
MTAHPDVRMTVADYLAFERTSPTKHEYLAGIIHAMAGASVAHHIITGNLFASLHSQLRQRPCTVFPSDMRLALPAQQGYVYPDMMVVCGEITANDPGLDMISNPILLIEVLSSSTEQYDRRKKAPYYRMIPSLQEYLFVAQDEPYLEHFVRHSEHQWLFTEVIGVPGQVTLASIDVTLVMEEIYAKLPPS